jgi:hypothetical protein
MTGEMKIVNSWRAWGFSQNTNSTLMRIGGSISSHTTDQQKADRQKETSPQRLNNPQKTSLPALSIDRDNTYFFNQRNLTLHPS